MTIIPPPLTNPAALPLTLEQRASNAGRVAFERGAKRVPAQDPEMMEIIRASDTAQRILRQKLGQNAGPFRMGACLPLLGAWLAAWDAANLATPVSGVPR